MLVPGNSLGRSLSLWAKDGRLSSKVSLENSLILLLIRPLKGTEDFLLKRLVKAAIVEVKVGFCNYIYIYILAKK